VRRRQGRFCVFVSVCAGAEEGVLRFLLSESVDVCAIKERVERREEERKGFHHENLRVSVGEASV